MHVTRLLPAYIITVLLLATHAIAGAIEDGSKAYRQGNYAEAYHLLQPLAAQGDAVAQEVLGVMYAEGQGVQKDEAQAVQLFRQAAEQGNDRGQYNLGAASLREWSRRSKGLRARPNVVHFGGGAGLRGREERS